MKHITCTRVVQFQRPFHLGFSYYAALTAAQRPLLVRKLSGGSHSSPKPYYCTTPIFYVNAAPHIGHLYSLVLADILKRWQVLQGRTAILGTGTDEHGMKIQRAAAHASMSPRAFCDQNCKAFQSLAKKANIDYDHFIRTSEPDHYFVVRHFWMMLKERGYIFLEKHEGWYSVSDEAFYRDSDVRPAMDPATGRKHMASIETGKEVEFSSESNYHFRLSALREPLLKFYAENPRFVVPSTKMKDVIQAVSDGLEDLSISRPSERLQWGIPVPDDESQTIYVWLDALVNYITKANYPFQIKGQESAAGWPADVHVIGKDIVRFHCIYWPAFLMALDIAPPAQVLAHAHWTIGKEKMAKSTGTGVNPFFAIDRFGVDPMRYYLACDGGVQDDSAYDNSLITRRYKKDLFGGVGNLASRVTRGKGWSVRRAVTKGVEKAFKNASSQSQAHAELLNVLPTQVAQNFQDLNARGALHCIADVVYKTNSFMASSAPWALAKTGATDEVDSVIYLCAESLRICGILLQPYMPSKMSILLDMLGVSLNSRQFENTVLGSDASYGEPSIDIGVGLKGVLFPPLTTEFE